MSISRAFVSVRKNFKGFTLIELLVVIAIIGILSMIALVAVNSVREASRDAKRKTDLETIRAALELYKADASVYPVGSNDVVSVFGSSLTYGGKVYLQTITSDPTTGLYYRYKSDTGSVYILCAYMEGSSNTVCGSSSYGCGAIGGVGKYCNYGGANP